MIAITPTQKITHGARVLPAGETLIVEDVTAGEILMRAPSEVVKMTPRRVRIAELPPNSRLLIVRPGGYGDILFLTPILAAIRRTRPDVRISVALFPVFRDILKGNPDVEEVLDYPLSREEMERFGGVIWLENAVEHNKQAERLHIVDVFAGKAGIELEDRACRLFLSEKEKADATERFPSTSRRRVGIQVSASQVCRTYPPKLLQEVINLLISLGDEVYLFDRPLSVKVDRHPQIRNLTVENPPLTFRESCAVLQTCSGFIAPDSALCHAAGALGIPTVGLYGPFPWQLRTPFHASVYAFNGVCRVSPCFHHERGGQRWPEGGPCNISGMCDALASITPQRIVSKLNQIIK